MNAIALAVLLVVLLISLFALARRPGGLAGEDFLHVWTFSPWGKQFMLDFYGLEILLGLWMLSHAAAHDSLPFAISCLVAMPILGAMPPALYWLLIVGS